MVCLDFLHIYLAHVCYFPRPSYDQYFGNLSNSTFLSLVITFTDEHKLRIVPVSDWATGWASDGKLISLFAKTHGPSLGYTEAPVLWISGPVLPGV